MFPSTSSRETSGLSGKQNELFPSEPYIKCILFTLNNASELWYHGIFTNGFKVTMIVVCLRCIVRVLKVGGLERLRLRVFRTEHAHEI